MADLWLFDIDGTLVNANDIHIRAYDLDYQEVMGFTVPADTLVKSFGPTDDFMHRKILDGMGKSYDDDQIRWLIAAHPGNFERIIGGKNIDPLSGVVDTLDYLKEQGHYLAVVTGNMEKPARLLLESSGLMERFAYFKCDDGSKGRTREQIVQSAIDEARSRNYEFDRVVVVGDTAHDITAGKAVEAFTVGVATGSYDLERLGSESPDIVIPDLTHYRRILDML